MALELVIILAEFDDTLFEMVLMLAELVAMLAEFV